LPVAMNQVVEVKMNAVTTAHTGPVEFDPVVLIMASRPTGMPTLSPCAFDDRGF
jgi:hypothetical protein